MPENDFYKLEESFVTFLSRTLSLRADNVSRKRDIYKKCAVIW
jgi:hypothetical protein